MKIKKRYMSGCARSWEQEYIIGINFRPHNSEKVKTTKFSKFSIFINYANFQLNLYVLYLPTGTVLLAEIFTTDTTYRALQDRICFSQFKGLLCFCGRNPMD